MEWYGHLLSHFFLTLFNAAANPCLYILRMPFFRQWLMLIVKNPNMLFEKMKVLKRMITSSLRLSSRSSPSSTSRYSSRYSGRLNSLRITIPRSPTPLSPTLRSPTPRSVKGDPLNDAGMYLQRVRISVNNGNYLSAKQAESD